MSFWTHRTPWSAKSHALGWPCPVAFSAPGLAVSNLGPDHSLAPRFTTNLRVPLTTRSSISYRPRSPAGASSSFLDRGLSCPLAPAEPALPPLTALDTRLRADLPATQMGCYNLKQLPGLALVQPSIKNFPF